MAKRDESKPSAMQLRYALERAKQVRDEKFSVIRADMNKTSQHKGISYVELCALIRSGKVKVANRSGSIQPYKNSYSGGWDVAFPNIDAVFDLSDVVYADKRDHAEFDKRIAELDKATDRLKDQLILGDVQTALTALETFAKTKF